MRTARRMTASLIDAKNWKTGLRCQFGREVVAEAAMRTGIFRENSPGFNFDGRDAARRRPDIECGFGGRRSAAFLPGFTKCGTKCLEMRSESGGLERVE